MEQPLRSPFHSWPPAELHQLAGNGLFSPFLHALLLPCLRQLLYCSHDAVIVVITKGKLRVKKVATKREFYYWFFPGTFAMNASIQ